MLYRWRLFGYSKPIHWLVHGHKISKKRACLPPNASHSFCSVASGQHRENYDVIWETVHCYMWNVEHCCTWSERRVERPDVVARISVNFSKFAFVLFCHVTNHLVTGPLGNSEFCFPRISTLPKTKLRETLRFESPHDQTLSVYYSLVLWYKMQKHLTFLS